MPDCGTPPGKQGTRVQKGVDAGLTGMQVLQGTEES